MNNKVLSEKELIMIERSWTNEASMKKIEENWEKFQSLVEKITSPRKEKFQKMIKDLEEQIVLAPASSRLEFHNAFPGGFVDHSLRVFNNTLSLAKTWNLKSVSSESLIISTLFHDWGKVGSLERPYYITETSTWHKQRGKMYNVDFQMPNAQLGLFVMNEYGISLSKDEYLSILLNDGQYAQENKPYAMKETHLSLLVHFSDRWSSEQEKNRHNLLSPLS